MTWQDFLKIFLEHWVPAIFTVAVGGYLATVLFPRWLDRYHVSKQRAGRRVEVAEKVVIAFSRYLVSLRRLIQISTLEAQRPLNEDEKARKNDFVVKRNDRRDDLVDHLNVCRLLFTGRTSELVLAFFIWDEDQTAKRLPDLPPLQDWRDWERRVVSSLRQDLNDEL